MVLGFEKSGSKGVAHLNSRDMGAWYLSDVIVSLAGPLF
jgi:hypothetical protein